MLPYPEDYHLPSNSAVDSPLDYLLNQSACLPRMHAQRVHLFEILMILSSNSTVTISSDSAVLLRDVSVHKYNSGAVIKYTCLRRGLGLNVFGELLVAI